MFIIHNLYEFDDLEGILHKMKHNQNKEWDDLFSLKFVQSVNNN